MEEEISEREVPCKIFLGFLSGSMGSYLKFGSKLLEVASRSGLITGVHFDLFPLCSFSQGMPSQPRRQRG